MFLETKARYEMALKITQNTRHIFVLLDPTLLIKSLNYLVSAVPPKEIVCPKVGVTLFKRTLTG